ncbi:hypothetical protein J0X19_00685 [Hymenobacter sp. BT186]|uniref:TIGR02646 family protein n=1 Tax=Hymenobacter telluris TaxID=2816474 RepID=A0A939ESG2_9BACT|nr:hypothetical protein [Hymenobacter telluris]MBO0356447.1 hypothetical protein [Hymenobacter telluris]MBW3372471.1 hypothetical protein [Hymenobacter norwichensis]
MIRIRKRATAPAMLTTLGTADRQRLEGIFAADPAACQVPRNQQLVAKPAIYGAAAVKAALAADQRGKCCYCESKFEATGFGDVEHFRPKAGVRQQPKSALEKPGYYWLAYEWSNLLYSCEICNRRHKSNWFPLLNPARRARQHDDQLWQERPLLPHPCRTDPATELTFNRHVAVEKNLSARGVACIRAYGLNRPPLRQRRYEFLETLKLIRFAASLDIDGMTPTDLRLTLTDLHMTKTEARRYVARARQVWEQAAFDAAEYAGMMRANFPHLPH